MQRRRSASMAYVLRWCPYASWTCSSRLHGINRPTTLQSACGVARGGSLALALARRGRLQPFLLHEEDVVEILRGDTQMAQHGHGLRPMVHFVEEQLRGDVALCGP